MTIKYLTRARCITRWKFCSSAMWITQTFIWTSKLKVYRSVLYPHDSYFVLQNTSFWYLKYLHHLVRVVEFICLTNNPSHHHLFIRIVSWFNYIPFHPCGRGSMEPRRPVTESRVVVFLVFDVVHKNRNSWNCRY